MRLLMQNIAIVLLVSLIIGINLYSYLILKRKLRIAPNKTTRDQISSYKAVVLLFVFIAFFITGSMYRLIERDSFSMVGATPQLLKLSFLSAVPICILVGIALMRAKEQSARTLPLLLYPVLALANSGVLLTINGALDFSRPHKYQVQVIRKYYKAQPSGRTGSRNQLIVSDWKSPDETVRLYPDESLLISAEVGDKLNVEVGSGLLGMEWVKNIQLLPQNHL